MTKPTQKIKKLFEDKTGVSPIIAVILMVAITVVLAATIYVWVSGFGGGGGGSASLAVTQLDGATDGNATIQIDSATQGTAWENINITVDGDWNLVEGLPDTDYIQAGQTFYVNGTASLAGSILKILDTQANSVLVSKTLW